MVLYGARLCGKVHEVPGVFYITTRFLHVLWVPLVPTVSWLVLDAPAPGRKWFSVDRKGVPLRCIRWGSVLMAWLRSLLLLVATLSIWSAAALHAAQSPWLQIVACVVAALGCVLGIWWSYRGSRATLGNLDELANVPGVPAEVIASARFLLSRRAKQ